MIEQVLAQSRYLGGGFAINLLISILAMAIGTVLGAVLGAIRFHRLTGLSAAARLATNLCRNVPSFVLLFYMASMLPAEIEVNGAIVAVPLWIKATLALIFPVAGFASDQSLGYLRQRHAQIGGAAETFAVAWMQYFLIVIMASATASVIGADEIVGRANNLISRVDDPYFMLVVYLYVSVWFLAVGMIFSGLLKVTMRRRVEKA